MKNEHAQALGKLGAKKKWENIRKNMTPEEISEMMTKVSHSRRKKFSTG